MEPGSLLSAVPELVCVCVFTLVYLGLVWLSKSSGAAFLFQVSLAGRLAVLRLSVRERGCERLWLVWFGVYCK